MKGLYDDLFFNSLLVCWGRRGQNIQEIVHGYPIPVIVHGYPMMVSMVLYFVGKKCVGKFVFSNTCILLQTSDKLLVTGYTCK